MKYFRNNLKFKPNQLLELNRKKIKVLFNQIDDEELGHDASQWSIASARESDCFEERAFDMYKYKVNIFMIVCGI